MNNYKEKIIRLELALKKKSKEKKTFSKKN